MKLLKRIRHFRRLSQIEKELTEEMDHHRAMSGEPAMGDIDQALREAAGVWRWPLIDRLGRLRSAPRWFARRFWNIPGRAVSFVEGLGSIAFIAVLFGWRWLTGTPLTTRSAIWLGAAYLCCALLQGIVQGFVRGALEAKGERKREFVKDSEAVLELAKLTGYESIRPFNRYLGKWMTMEGEFEGSAESFEGDAFHVSLRIDDGRRFKLKFGREQRERLQPLQPGQRVTAVGEIVHEFFELRLENCEVVRIEPLRAASRLTLAS